MTIKIDKMTFGFVQDELADFLTNMIYDNESYILYDLEDADLKKLIRKTKDPTKKHFLKYILKKNDFAAERSVAII